MHFSRKTVFNVLLLLFFGAIVYIFYHENSQNSTFYMAPSVTDEYNVWCIFTKANSSYKLRQNFKQFAHSLVLNTTIPFKLHIISDNSSAALADDILNSMSTKTEIKWEHHNIQVLASKLKDITYTMQQHFSSQPGSYYSDVLFFLSIGLHRVTNQNRAIMIDIDTSLRIDVKLLFDEFNNFKSSTLLGAVPEQTPVYRHLLHKYRASHRETKFGDPLSSGGNPGVNSGVLLLNLKGQRESALYQSLLAKEKVAALCDKYHFHGHLGDQDWYTLISQEHPDLIHFLDCTWNRQLCLWWRHHGYHDIFDLFHYCTGEVKIYHGNCNSEIPQ